MPFYAAPISDITRFAFLQKATKVGPKDQTAIKEYADIDEAKLVQDDACKADADLPPAVAAIIQDIADQLRFNLRKEEASNQRVLMRRYSATFRYLKDEPIDPDDTNPVVEEEAFSPHETSQVFRNL